jgi:DNA uptake protein ComE-like DNA-binding protein
MVCKLANSSMALFSSPPEPYNRFRSIAQLQSAAQRGERIAVHSATVDDWLRLPGISIHQAKALVNLQNAGLELYSIEDLAAALEMPLHRVQGWSVILSFEYHHPEAAPLRIDPNRASLAELQQILAPALAEQIAAERQMGEFQSLGDLQQRLQLDGPLLNQLLPYFRFKS